ncbi:hypothetical protein DXB25_24085 [Lachnospiraceae bacterium OM02-31]|nr:hypothetical protein DXC97_12765 [Lachnospiraceae bacterium TF09-5]RJW43766.1 hypothetical protein DXB25_24085 [Lachnospiraceae bacterium OM02-31]RJW55354.1 hypothetical protein DXB24_21525 [Lachnospiraceae bacterium OM02-3]
MQAGAAQGGQPGKAGRGNPGAADGASGGCEWQQNPSYPPYRLLYSAGEQPDALRNTLQK